MGQAFFDAIVRKLVAVEAAETVASAEPKKVVRVSNDSYDEIARQPVGSSIDSHGQLFTKDAANAEKKEKAQARPKGEQSADYALRWGPLTRHSHFQCIILRS